MAFSIAFSLECEFRRTNNLLDILAALFERADKEKVRGISTPEPPKYNELNICGKDKCKNCVGHRWIDYGGSLLLLQPQPEYQGRSYAYRAATPRPVENESELTVREDDINEVLHYVALGSGIDNFSTTENFTFTPKLHARLRYVSNDPAIVVWLWATDRPNTSSWREFQACKTAPWPENLIDPHVYQRFFALDKKEQTDLTDVLHWSSARESRLGGDFVSEVSRVTFKAGKPVGTLIIDVNMSHINDVLQNLRLAPNVFSAIVDATNGDVAMMTQRARDYIFYEGMTEAVMKNRKGKPSCKWGSPSNPKKCWWTPPRPYNVYDALNLSGINMTRLLEKTKEAHSPCNAGVKKAYTEAPKRSQTLSVAYCDIYNVANWVLLIFAPKDELVSEKLKLSRTFINHTVEEGSPDPEPEVLQLENLGHTPVSVLIEHSDGGMIEVEKDRRKLRLEPKEKVDVKVNFDMTDLKGKLGYGEDSKEGTLVVRVDPDDADACSQPPVMAKFHVTSKRKMDAVRAWMLEYWPFLLAALMLLMAIILGRFVNSILRSYFSQLAEEAQIVEKSLQVNSTLVYPMVLLKVRTFKSLGKFVAHEDVIDKTFWLHSIKEIDKFLETKRVIFMSHQWTAFASPDPTGIQYQQMVMAVDTLCSERGWEEEDVFVWLDYSSIPQRHRGLQTLAINSLTIYAAKVSAFVVVAPPVEHSDLKDVCNKFSYMRRAWCRAEQLSHFMAKSDEEMWLAEGGKLTHLSEEPRWLEQATRVFAGEMTCCRRQHEGMELCDRQRLVVPMLGLWGQLCCLAKDAKGEDERYARVHKSLSDRKDEVFPSTFSLVTKEGTRESSLFGRLVSLLEKRLEQLEEQGKSFLSFT
eukprot:TRINITY_DN29058_c0_g1_i1.p1 TRINITY_DN29058_c0_g1~~TRINITY_DN29058_c0_g1_i1.p1  ORF type:complete len:974 (-),score=177.30 TRINITY_DN29058_c0_g1_i1:131-2719(-)